MILSGFNIRWWDLAIVLFLMYEAGNYYFGQQRFKELFSDSLRIEAKRLTHNISKLSKHQPVAHFYMRTCFVGAVATPCLFYSIGALSHWWWVGPSLFVVGMRAFSALRQPVAGIYLGASSRIRFSEFNAYGKKFRPLRLVSLLDTDKNGIRQPSSDELFPFDERTATYFRLVDGVDWEVVVVNLMEVSGLIILDLSELTPAVRRELLRLKDFAYKTVVGGFDNATRVEPEIIPLLNEFRESGACFAADSKEIRNLLRFFVIYATELPSVERPVRDLSNRMAAWISTQADSLGFNTNFER